MLEIDSLGQNNMYETIELIIYFVSLLTFFTIVFKILRGLNVEGMFKKNHVWEIKAFYIVTSLISAHILSQIILKFYEWAIMIIS